MAHPYLLPILHSFSTRRSADLCGCATAKVDPVADHEATFAEAQPWLTGPYRASFLKRFQARLDDPAFRDAMATSGKAPPEWSAATPPPKVETPPPAPAAKAEPEKKFKWPWEK